MADKPITRKELFLAKAGGQDVKTPEPITREERFLEAIANGGGGGGGGLPEITPGAQTIIFPQTTLAFEDGEYYDEETALSLTAGESYTISWDGTDYVCASTPSEDKIFIGNLSLINPSLPDTGEPFAIDYYYGEGATELTIVADDDNASHSIGITQGTAQTPPDGTALSVNNGEWEASGHVLPAPAQWSNITIPTEFSFSEVQTGIYVGGGSVIGWALNVGDVLRLTWDGTPYEITLFDFQGSLVGGNTSIVGIGTDTGEPFLVYFEGNGHYQFITKETEASHIISFDQREAFPDGTTMQVIDGEWVPVEPSGNPSSGTLICHADDDTGEFDATWQSIFDALSVGSRVVLVYSDSLSAMQTILYIAMHDNNSFDVYNTPILSDATPIASCSSADGYPVYN